MARFRYKCIGGDGKVVSGDVTAGSRDAALAQLRSRGLAPLSVSERAASAGPSRIRLGLRRRRVTAADLTIFTREMSVLLASGMPLDRGLKLMERLGGSTPMGRVCGGLLARVANGAPLSESMRDHGEIFPQYYSGMVAAGEAGGVLPAVFARLFEMLERRDALTAKVRAAMTYPLIVLILTALSIIVLMVLVIPEFKPIFAQAGDALPLTTRAIVAASDFAVDFGAFGAIGLLVLGLLVSRIRLSAGVRTWLDRQVLALPLVGPLVRALETGRFTQMLGTLYANGVSLVDAVRISADTLQNSAMSRGVMQAVDPLSQGKGLSKPLADTGYFPDLAIQLIEVGEESGRLGDMLLQVSAIYEVEAERKIQSVLSLLVPLITVALGIIVAVVIGSIMSAILGSYRIAL